MRGLLRHLPRFIREPLIRRHLQFDHDVLGELTVKVAETVEEHEQAGRLIHESYVRRGLMPPHASGLWVTPHGLLPTTMVFVARHGEAIVGTMSLVVDSALGLPMDKIFAEELAPLRQAGRLVAEAGALCVAPDYRNKGVALLLNKLMWRCAKERLSVQDLVIAVHPDVQCLYEAVQLFRRVGPVRMYPGLSGKAALLELDLETAEERMAKAFGHRGADATNPHYLYYVAEHPQIQLPDAGAIASMLANVRVRSAEHLSRLKPDCFSPLDNRQRRVLRMILPSLHKRLGTVLP